MNLFIFSGRLTKDPVVREFTNEKGTTKVYNFTVALDRGKKNGEDAGADFADMTYFVTSENMVKFLDQNLKKGVLVYDGQGTYKSDSYTDNEGKTVYTKKFDVRNMKVMTSTPSSTAAPQTAAPAQTPAPTPAADPTPATTPTPQAAAPTAQTATAETVLATAEDMPWD